MLKDNMKTLQQFVEEHPVGFIVPCVAVVGILVLRRWKAGGVCHSTTHLDGKTVLITGANTGIGKETALDMAKRGARVILACRDLDKAHAAAEEIRKKSGNGNVTVKKLDLASLRSVRNFAREIQEKEDRLDILINNAGIMMCPKWKTEDGFEMQFGVNHLGHFLLTNLLLDQLKRSTPSRIVNVSSRAHERGQINFEDINMDQNYHPLKSYSQSKLANVLFSRELAIRLKGTGVTVYSLHPGVVRTELGRHFFPFMALWKRILYAPFFLLLKTPWEGAQTTIFCAVDESLQNTSGLYYSDCAVKAEAPQAKDDAAAKRLWDLSISMVNISMTLLLGTAYTRSDTPLIQ
ncbi:retinol dehydrogenase 13 isoform X2 [Hoplias malabaricus]|uniref:retinol dehydrogenase 13 isoform X2 n=1 Tax=Hoplias malabaricus TaxID=27720 RepID=UPI003463094C